MYRRRMGGYVVTAARSGLSPCPRNGPNGAHGPHVDDDSEWYVLDEADCPSLGLSELNHAPVVVPCDPPATQADCYQVSAEVWPMAPFTGSQFRGAAKAREA